MEYSQTSHYTTDGGTGGGGGGGGGGLSLSSSSPISNIGGRPSDISLSHPTPLGHQHSLTLEADGIGARGEHIMPRGRREFSYESSSAVEEGPSVDLNTGEYYDDNYVSDDDSDYDSDVVSKSASFMCVVSSNSLPLLTYLLSPTPRMTFLFLHPWEARRVKVRV